MTWRRDETAIAHGRHSGLARKGWNEGKQQEESERRKMGRSGSRRARCGGHEFNTPLSVEGAFLHGASDRPSQGDRAVCSCFQYVKQARRSESRYWWKQGGTCDAPEPLGAAQATALHAV